MSEIERNPALEVTGVYKTDEGPEWVVARQPEGFRVIDPMGSPKSEAFNTESRAGARLEAIAPPGEWVSLNQQHPTER